MRDNKQMASASELATILSDIKKLVVGEMPI